VIITTWLQLLSTGLTYQDIIEYKDDYYYYSCL
jgi:hypothetical protein